MNFKNLKFSELFLSKHGKDTFEQLTTLIKNEKKDKCDNNYIEIIFKVSFMDFFGLDNYALNKMLKEFNFCDDIEKIKNIHKNSIRIIKEYILNSNQDIEK